MSNSIVRNLLESLTEILWKIYGTFHFIKRSTKNETRTVIPQLSIIRQYLWLMRETPAIQTKIKNQFLFVRFFLAAGMLKWQNFIQLFHIVHDSLCLPPKILHNRCLFDFSWEDFYTQEKLELMVIQNLGGGERVNKVHYGGCENGKLLWIANHSLAFFRSLAHASKQPIKEQEIITRMHSVVRKIQIKTWPHLCSII